MQIYTLAYSICKYKHKLLYTVYIYIYYICTVIFNISESVQLCTVYIYIYTYTYIYIYNMIDTLICSPPGQERSESMETEEK